MTERIKWQSDDPENEPIARLGLPDGETFEARRDTATLWTFLGRLAIYNHIHCHETDGEEVKQSFYIFNFVEGYDRLAAYMAENNYPMILNQTEVSVTDQEAYDRAVRATFGDIGDYVPDEWIDKNE